jgi:hypothetical protein
MEQLVDESQYVTVPVISREMKVSVPTVHSWLRYHRYMPCKRAFRNIVVLRSDYEKFKDTRPDLVAKAKAQAARREVAA